MSTDAWEWALAFAWDGGITLHPIAAEPVRSDELSFPAAAAIGTTTLVRAPGARGIWTLYEGLDERQVLEGSPFALGRGVAMLADRACFGGAGAVHRVRSQSSLALAACLARARRATAPVAIFGPATYRRALVDAIAPSDLRPLFVQPHHDRAMILAAGAYAPGRKFVVPALANLTAAQRNAIRELTRRPHERTASLVIGALHIDELASIGLVASQTICLYPPAADLLRHPFRVAKALAVAELAERYLIAADAAGSVRRGSERLGMHPSTIYRLRRRATAASRAMAAHRAKKQ